MTIRLLAGDAREMLATLSDASVHCVVTSPPYWCLRDYGTATWDGGDAECDHLMKQPKRGKAEYTNGQGGSFSSNLQAWGDRDVSTVFRDTCGKCGATRVDRQIGLEATPEAYLETMVAVFRQVRRVLRHDGVMFLNIGDSHVSTGGMTSGGSDFSQWQGGQTLNDRDKANRRHTGLKPKDLLMMPARLALALQADGWWVRSDIIWAKPNPMPESVTDRPTSAHEHVFLLTKNARYFYDAEAVREDAEYGRSTETVAWHAKADANSAGVHFKNTTTPGSGGSRNLRNVWIIATHAYSQAHFATFPPALVERCVRAGTSERGCCAQCGSPWRRVVEKGAADLAHQRASGGDANGEYHGQSTKDHAAHGVQDASAVKARILAGMVEKTTTGWSPSCEHRTVPVPCTVLDPFFGAGTTGLVASRLGRDCIGIDLNPDYNAMSRARIEADAPLFAAFPVVDPADERQADLWQEPAAK